MKTLELAEYLPHRPPMVWVDSVDQIFESGGICSVRPDRHALYFDKTDIRWSAPIEWIAQSYGFVKAAQVASGMIQISELPKVTFLAQVSDAEVVGSLESDHFLVEVTLRRALGPMSLVNGVVRHKSGKLVAMASLKLFAQ